MLCRFCFLPISPLAEPQTLPHTDVKAQINSSKASLLSHINYSPQGWEEHLGDTGACSMGHMLPSPPFTHRKS